MAWSSLSVKVVAIPGPACATPGWRTAGGRTRNDGRWGWTPLLPPIADLAAGTVRSGTRPSVELADLSDFIVVARVPGGDFEPASRPCYAAGPMTIRGERRQREVLVTVDGTPLDWRALLVVRNHSPTGPAWGYSGSGPAQSGAGDPAGGHRRGDGPSGSTRSSSVTFLSPRAESVASGQLHARAPVTQ